MNQLNLAWCPFWDLYTCHWMDKKTFLKNILNYSLMCTRVSLERTSHWLQRSVKPGKLHWSSSCTCYGGWSLIRESILSVFGDRCKDLQFLTLINFLDNYLPLVLTIYVVVFRSNNFQLYISALKRIWLMFPCFGHHHYDKSPLVFLSSILYWEKISHPFLLTLKSSIVSFTEYPVEYFHSVIRDQTNLHSSAEEITKTCRSIFTSKH